LPSGTQLDLVVHALRAISTCTIHDVINSSVAASGARSVGHGFTSTDAGREPCVTHPGACYAASTLHGFPTFVVMRRVTHVLYTHAAGHCTRRRTASPHDTSHAHAPDDDAEQGWHLQTKPQVRHVCHGATTVTHTQISL
jgi:hypothetical protein